MIENKKFVAFILIALLGMGLIFVMSGTQHIANNQKFINVNESLSQEKLNHKNVYILSITVGNQTLHFYDSNYTLIKNFNPQVKPFLFTKIEIPANSYSDGSLTTTSNINNDIFNGVSLAKTYFNGIISGSINSGNFTAKILFSFSGDTTFTIYTTNTVNFSLFDLSLVNGYAYYIDSGNLTGAQFDYTFSQASFSQFSNNTAIHTRAIFTQINGYYNVSFTNNVGNGTLTIKNTSGYNEVLSIKNLQTQYLLLKNGSYNYSLRYGNNYTNASFIVNGSNLIITILPSYPLTNTPTFAIFFILIEFLASFLIYVFTQRYYILIGINAVFILIGYASHIMYYNLYFISIIILILSLITGAEIMNKIGD